MRTRASRSAGDGDAGGAGGSVSCARADQIAIGRRQNTPPDLRVTPGRAYLYGPCQLTIGTQVALNRTASHNVQSAVLTLLDIDLDEIIPGAGWEAM